jgi:hypothetical protein
MYIDDIFDICILWDRKRLLKKRYRNQKGQSRNTANIGHTTKQEN